MNRAAQSAIEGTAHRVDSVDSLDSVARLFGSHEANFQLNAADHQNSVVRLHFSGDFRDQLAVAGIVLRRSDPALRARFKLK